MKKIYALALGLFATMASYGQVVISQVYGGGGNSGAVYNRDFVELFNKGNAAVDISGWSLQYQSATNTANPWNMNVIPSGATIQPGKYYLVAFGAAGANGTALPTADFDYSTGTPTPLAMSGTNGRIALVNNGTALAAGCNAGSANIVDLVGYGSSICYEGTAATPALTNSTAAIRLNNGCTDTNSNGSDFTTGTPAARNSSSATNVCTSAPTLTITSPADATVYAPSVTTVDIAVTVTNFTVANGTGDGHIKYTVNGGAANYKYDTTPLSLTPLTPGNYTVVLELVNNSNASLSTPVTDQVVFTIASYTTVANLAALRADVAAVGAGKYYIISSQPVITYARSTTTYKQKYVQDSTAGVLIHDDTNAITTNSVIGDAVSGLKGKTLLYNGLLELVPTADATVASSGNTITPEVVTLSQLTANVGNYESELIKVSGLTFTTADGTAAFATSTNYDITDGTTSIFRTSFSEADYITGIIPQGTLEVVALVGNYNGTAQITARNLADMTVLANENFDQISGLNVYPNPVTGSYVYITSHTATEKAVTLYDITGKVILTTNTLNNSINVSDLQSGIYMLQVTEQGKTATRKLVIR